MTLEKLDHFVLPVSDVDGIAMFYTTYLGMEKRVFGVGMKLTTSVRAVVETMTCQLQGVFDLYLCDPSSISAKC